MIITVGNVQARVAGPEPELDWLAEYLCFEDATAHHRRRYGYRGDGKIHAYKRFGSTMPSGFVGMVKEAAEKEGTQVTIIDARRRTCDPDEQCDIRWLRDYQRDAVKAVVENTRGILHMATGAGKTEVFAALTRALPCRWLFLVHRNQLVDQAATRVETRTGISVGRCAEGAYSTWEGHQVICASFQSIHAALKRGDAYALALLDGAEAVCIDESHVLPADSYLSVINHTKNAYWRVGLSGTPLARGDKRSVLAIGAIGKVIYKLRAQALVDAGVLAQPKIRLVPVIQEATATTHQGIYGELIVRSVKRNKAIVAAVMAAEKPCMVFVKELSHGKLLEKMLCKAGVATSFVSGQHSTDWRKSHVKSLEAGRFDALIASVVFQEGVDIPDLRSVVVACGGKSTIAALQRIGRGMRKAAGKTTFEVWDIADEGCAMMKRQAQARRTAYLNEKFEVTITNGLVR